MRPNVPELRDTLYRDSIERNPARGLGVVPLLTSSSKSEQGQEKKMEMEIAIWNGKKSKVLMVDTFNSSREALDFLREVQAIDKDATMQLIGVRKKKS